jgi:hypothetical protein
VTAASRKWRSFTRSMISCRIKKDLFKNANCLLFCCFPLLCVHLAIKLHAPTN